MQVLGSSLLLYANVNRVLSLIRLCSQWHTATWSCPHLYPIYTLALALSTTDNAAGTVLPL